MKFVHRLAYYLFGIFIGCLFLYFIFSNKQTEFCYLPNCRVLKNIREKNLVVGDTAKIMLNQNWVSMEDVKMSLSYGDVDFSKSNTSRKGGGKLYIIEGRNADNENITLHIVNYGNKAELTNIIRQ